MIPSGWRKSRSTTRLVLCGGLAAIAATLSASPPDSHIEQKSAKPGRTLLSARFESLWGVSTTSSLERVLPSGILEPLGIPAGRALVVTDVEWTALPRDDGLFVPGSSVVMVIQLGTSNNSQALRSRMIPIAEETKGARPGSSERLTTGFAVR